jgi:oxygen-independent coproporphyrinogen-3 oxidase
MSREITGSSQFLEARDLGLYFHIPFCTQKCSYCDFYSESKSTFRDCFVELLKKEILLHLKNSPSLKQLPIKTIFFGGGTPSTLTSSEWLEIGEIINDSFNLTHLEEWSIECNPESFTEEKAKTWLSIGINRLSFGVQSLNPQELKAINRVHSRDDVLNLLSLDIIKEFKSISVDIIYALPFQNELSLRETITTLLSFDVVKHISAYELTLAEGTPLFNKPENIPNEDESEQLTNLCHTLLNENGFTRYEVSNFAKEGEICKHNMRYWRREPYLGLGPAAHSFDGNFRWSNPSSLSEYAKKIDDNLLPMGSLQKNSTDEVKEEFLFLSLRLAEGFSEYDFEYVFEEPFESESRMNSISLLLKEGYIEKVDSRWRVTDFGFSFVDGIVERLI